MLQYQYYSATMEKVSLVVNIWRFQIMGLSVKISFSFPSHRKAEPKDVGTRIAISPRAPIILCVLFAYIDLVVEQKTRTLQVTEWVKFHAPAGFKCNVCKQIPHSNKQKKEKI